MAASAATAAPWRDALFQLLQLQADMFHALHLLSFRDLGALVLNSGFQGASPNPRELGETYLQH
jgi:hypothetical protein